MILCLVTLTDLQTRRAGLSASAELLVLVFTISYDDVYCCLLFAAAVKLDSSNCEPQWHHTFSPEFVPHTANVNYTECRQACDFDRRCTAIKWDSTSPVRCYLKIQPENVRYEEIRRCAVDSGLYLSTSRVFADPSIGANCAGATRNFAIVGLLTEEPRQTSRFAAIPNWGLF